MKIRLSTLVLLAIITLGGVAVSQTFLGNVIQLGQSTTVSLPTASTTNKGGLIFDTTVGAPKYSDGTAWQPLGGSSSSFFYDAGWGLDGGTTGFMQTDNPITKNDGGTVLTSYVIPLVDDPTSITAEGPRGLRTNSITVSDFGRAGINQGIGDIQFWTRDFTGAGTMTFRGSIVGTSSGWTGSGLTDGINIRQAVGSGNIGIGRQALYYGSREALYLGQGMNTSGVDADAARLSVKGGAGGEVVHFFGASQNVTSTTPMFAMNDNGRVALNAASGNDAIKFLVDGARMHFGTGTTDYLVGNGSRVVSPGALEFSGSAPQVWNSGDTSLRLANVGLTSLTAQTTVPGVAVQQVTTPDAGDPLFTVGHGALNKYVLEVNFASPAVLHDGLQIGGGNAATGQTNATPITASIRGTTTNPGSCTNNTCTDTTITVTGAASGAECAVGVPAVSPNAALQFTCYVSAADTVKFRCCNVTGTSQTPPAGTYSVRVFNP